MAKKIDAYIKLQVAAGQANPSPPVGPALGQRGLNIMEFCKQFNARTKETEAGTPIPVVITCFSDKSFHLYYQDAAGLDPSQEGGWYPEWQQDAAHPQGGQGDTQAA